VKNLRADPVKNIDIFHFNCVCNGTLLRIWLYVSFFSEETSEESMEYKYTKRFFLPNKSFYTSQRVSKGSPTRILGILPSKRRQNIWIRRVGIPLETLWISDMVRASNNLPHEKKIYIYLRPILILKKEYQKLRLMLI